MTSVARIRVDDDGVRLVEVVVAAENAVAVRRIRGESGAGDFRGFDVHGDDALGDAVRDKGDKLRVIGRAALRQELVEMVAAGDIQHIHRAILMAFIALCHLLKGQQRCDFVVPDGVHRTHQHDHQRQQDAEDGQQYFLRG